MSLCTCALDGLSLRVETGAPGSWAAFDQSGTYRYALVRAWEPDRPTAVFIMLNPSTADAFDDDPTIRRCLTFARREYCGALAVVNLFAYRSTDPAALKAVPDPVGPLNDRVIATVAATARSGDGITVAAWGTHAGPQRQAQARQILDRAGVPLYHLGELTKHGHPRHPLYLPGDAPLNPLY